MARTRVPVSGITRTGGSAPRFTAVDPDDGVSVANPDGRTVLIARNVGNNPHTLTVHITVTVDGQPVAPRTYTIPSGAIRHLGPFDNVRYSNTLLIDADSDELAVAGLRLGESLAGEPVVAAPFLHDPPAVAADLAFPGLTVDGNILVVDTVLTSSTVDGDALVVTV